MKLKPCPFCGNEEVRVYKMIKLLGHEHPGFVRCDCVEGVSVARWQDRPIEDALRAELARRDEIIKRLKEDGERLVIYYVGDSDHEHDDRIL